MSPPMPKVKTTWDETCPHCGVKLEALYDSFVGNDYCTHGFKATCEHCDRTIWVTVHAVPEYEITVKEPVIA